MRKKDLILVGGGGHCNACLDVLRLLNLYNVVGIIEKNNLSWKNFIMSQFSKIRN